MSTPVPPIEEKTTPLLKIRRVVVAVALAATFIATAWPGADLIYRGSFSTPGLWWVAVLASLAAWITATVLIPLDRILLNQNRHETRLDELVDSINYYGDQREVQGQLTKTVLNGVRQLRPVD